MKKLKVDIDQLMWTFEDAARENELFLNLQTGELIPEAELKEEDETIVNSAEEPGKDSHLLPVPEADPGSGFDDREDFVRTIADAGCRRELERALTGPKPFRRFKEMLHAYPSERERWFKFKEERTKNRILEWLHECGIEPIEEKGGGQEKQSI